MREIKFRALVADKWIYDFAWYPSSTSNTVFMSEDDAYEVLGDDFVDLHGEHYNEVVYFETDHQPDQFTGLKDKNGVEIYEGDIVAELGVYKIVEWINDAGGWNYRTLHIEGPSNYSAYVEVIGNIYQNPELVAVKPSNSPKKEDNQ